MSTTYQFRIDDETKRESFEVFRSFWMTPADAIRTYLRLIARTRSIPFPLDRETELAAIAERYVTDPAFAECRQDEATWEETVADGLEDA